MGPLRVGVIGATGGQGSSWVKRLAQWSKDGSFNIELVAFCDKNPAVKRKAEQFSNVEAYLDYREMYR